MTRLDNQIDAVRTRFLLQKLLGYAAWALLIAAGALVLAIVTTRLFAIALPPKLLLWGGIGLLCVGVSLVLAVVSSPSREATAVRMDEVLGLKERFSTALLARGSSDGFAQAAVRDAERTADSISIRKRFPFQFPRMGGWALLAVVLLLVADSFMPRLDLLNREETARQVAIQNQQRKEAKELAERALNAISEVNRIPNVAGREKAMETTAKDLQTLLSQPMKDPTELATRAQSAIQDAKAIQDRIKDAQHAADAMQQEKFFKSLVNGQPGGTMSEAKSALAEGKFDKAAAKLQDAVATFEKADAQKQQEMARDMQQMADEIKKLANDPNLQEKIKQQMQQAGATPEQTQRMMEEMQKAATGDKDAAQRAQEMMKNVARNANGGVLPAPKQLEKLMQQMQTMQGQMNSQQSAQQLSQAAQQLAQAMQKQAAQNQAGQKQQAQAGQKGQQNKGQGQQQQQGSQSQQGQQQGNSEVADAQQSMQEAMAQMEAMQQDAQMGNGSDGQDENEGGQFGQNPAGGNQGGKGQGQGPSGWNNGGQGMGERPAASPAPFTVKKELSPGEKDARGKKLASWFVKADSVRGESVGQLRDIAMSAERDATDDVDAEAVPMQAKQAVKKYFDSMQQQEAK